MILPAQEIRRRCASPAPTQPYGFNCTGKYQDQEAGPQPARDASETSEKKFDA